MPYLKNANGEIVDIRVEQRDGGVVVVADNGFRASTLARITTDGLRLVGCVATAIGIKTDFVAGGKVALLGVEPAPPAPLLKPVTIKLPNGDLIAVNVSPDAGETVSITAENLTTGLRQYIAEISAKGIHRVGSVADALGLGMEGNMVAMVGEKPAPLPKPATIVARNGDDLEFRVNEGHGDTVEIIAKNRDTGLDQIIALIDSDGLRRVGHSDVGLPRVEVGAAMSKVVLVGEEDQKGTEPARPRYRTWAEGYTSRHDVVFKVERDSDGDVALVAVDGNGAKFPLMAIMSDGRSVTIQGTPKHLGLDLTDLGEIDAH